MVAVLLPADVAVATQAAAASPACRHHRARRPLAVQLLLEQRIDQVAALRGEREPAAGVSECACVGAGGEEAKKAP